MAITNGTNLGLPISADAGEEWYEELRALLRGLDCLIQCTVKDKDLSAPPGAPTNGDTYIVAAGGSGAWNGHDGKIARWTTDTTVDAWEFFTPKAGWEAYVVDETYVYRHTGAAWARAERLQSIQVAASDLTTAITAGTNKVKFRIGYAFTLVEVRASLFTAQTSNGGGGIFTVDINEGGSTILSTKLTIDNTETTSKTAVTAAVISDASLADDAEISVDVDQVGDGTAKGLIITLIGRPT